MDEAQLLLDEEGLSPGFAVEQAILECSDERAADLVIRHLPAFRERETRWGHVLRLEDNLGHQRAFGASLNTPCGAGIAVRAIRIACRNLILTVQGGPKYGACPISFTTAELAIPRPDDFQRWRLFKKRIRKDAVVLQGRAEENGRGVGVEGVRSEAPDHLKRLMETVRHEDVHTEPGVERRQQHHGVFRPVLRICARLEITSRNIERSRPSGQEILVPCTNSSARSVRAAPDKGQILE